jgi:hypothetical protein
MNTGFFKLSTCVCSASEQRILRVLSKANKSPRKILFETQDGSVERALFL